MLTAAVVGAAAGAAIGYAVKNHGEEFVHDRDDFKIYGPVLLKNVNWNDIDHQRKVAASLVNGVYVLELDRQKKRAEDMALAPPWWRSFHFQEKIEKLIDEKDGSIYGAIYELEPQFQKIIGAPRFVIAYRGTLLKRKCLIQDLILDMKIIIQRIHRSKRCESATKAVEKIVFSGGKDPISTKLWVAGHSLGSALAIQAGKEMAEKGARLETFLFNPPFPSIFNEKPRFKRVKKVMRITTSIVTGITATIFKDHERRSKDEESFTKLSKWSPYVFVNRHDFFSSRYIAYFVQRKEMDKIGAGRLGREATPHSLWALLMNAFRGNEAYNAFYRLLSAKLFIQNDDSFSHEICQWWSVDSQLEQKVYCFSRPLLLREGEENEAQVSRKH